SSMGLSFLVPKEARGLAILVRWGDYTPDEIPGEDGKTLAIWQRRPREESSDVALTGKGGPPQPVPASGGLELHIVERLISAEDLADHIPQGTRSVSVFLVNRRPPQQTSPDEAFAFQTELEVRSECAFVPRPDLRGASPEDWDEQVADLHYADVPEYATGHGVSAEWETVDGACRVLRTAWIPSGE